MKFKQNYLLLSFVLLIVLFINSIEVKAMNTGFSTAEVSEETKNTFVSNINLSLLEAEPVKKEVLCFDVNSQGMLALGQKDSQEKIVCVYSSQGKFLYGYSFNCTQSFGVEWDEQYVNIYFVRSSIIISVDQNGEIQDIYNVPETKENNRYYFEFMSAAEKTVNDTEYILTNEGLSKVLASSYTKLIVRDIDGNENTIYDVSEKKNQSIIAYCIIFVTIAVVILLTTGNKQIKK